MAASILASPIPSIELPVVESAAAAVSHLLGFVFIFTAILLIYKFMPNTKTSWRYIRTGALKAPLLVEAARSAFSC